MRERLAASSPEPPGMKWGEKEGDIERNEEDFEAGKEGEVGGKG